MVTPTGQGTGVVRVRNNDGSGWLSFGVTGCFKMLSNSHCTPLIVESFSFEVFSVRGAGGWKRDRPQKETGSQKN